MNEVVATREQQGRMNEDSFCRSVLFDDSQHVILGHHEKVFTVNFDLGAGVGVEDDAITLLDAEGNVLARVLVEDAAAQRDDFAFLGLVLGGFGKVNAGVRLGLGFGTLNENLVAERSNVHVEVSLRVSGLGTISGFRLAINRGTRELKIQAGQTSA